MTDEGKENGSEESRMKRLRRIVIGAPRDINDPQIFHHASLIAFLAWIGLGADGLSSSSYGPDEAYRALGHHTHLALFLVLMTTVTNTRSPISATTRTAPASIKRVGVMRITSFP